MMKIRPNLVGGLGKFVLRQILWKYVLPQLIEPSNAGFGMPIRQWLRAPLRIWTEDLLESGLMQRQGYLRPGPVQLHRLQHFSGRLDHTTKLPAVPMWHAWLQEWE